VVQLTTDPDLPASHLYMEAQIFTMDSKHLLLHRAATAHGGNRRDPNHQYFRCDIEDGCSLHPIAEELGAWAPSVSPDGTTVYYFVEQTKLGSGTLTLKRVNLDGTDRRTLLALDGPVPGTSLRPSRFYPLSTISSDGKRLAISCFLGDGKRPEPTWGLLVFDLEAPSVGLAIQGPTWCNMHPQFSRSTNADERRDILIQENHGNEADPAGRVTKLAGGNGADIHVIRDDGKDFRTMPWGRDGTEYCQGHQCWRGRTAWGITSTSTRLPDRRETQLIEGHSLPDKGHLGRNTPGGRRNDLSRAFTRPHFSHFATDIAGKRLVTDAGPFDQGGRIFVADLGEPGRDEASNFTYLLNPRSSCQKTAHIHPFLSPDGRMAFFNSDESGILQAYMIRGLETV